jgi:ABC-type multidrug transport system ATPase subunit
VIKPKGLWRRLGVNDMSMGFLNKTEKHKFSKLRDGGSFEDEGKPTPVLEVRNIYKRFGRVQVLRGIDLRVFEGEAVGITGENGSGKSTLLKIIVGLLSYDQGEVHLSGTFGYCPQDPLIFNDLTMEENIAYFSTAYGLDEKKGLSRGSELMRMLGCEQFKNRLARYLSGGTRQKLNLIISLLHDPDILILDEPYQGFDYESYLSFWEIVKYLRGRGKSILVVSPMIYEYHHLTKIYKLEDGRLVYG